VIVIRAKARNGLAMLSAATDDLMGLHAPAGHAPAVQLLIKIRINGTKTNFLYLLREFVLILNPS
jgi:hypothetical protein